MTTPRRKRSHFYRVLAWIAGFVLLFALSLPTAVGVMLASFAGTRPQDRRVRDTPGDYGHAYRTVFLRSSDGVRIAAWLIRPRTPAGCSVVLAHGLFRSRQEVLGRGARLVSRGCRVLALDLRRHGESGGGRTSLGYFEAADVAAGADWLARRYPADRLYLAGVSMGGAAVARAAGELLPDVAGVVLDSTFRNVPEVVDRYAEILLGLPPFPAGDLTLVGLRIAAGFEPGDMDVEHLAARLGRRGIPVLVIAGDQDRRAPPLAQSAVFRANGHPESRMVVVEGASHGRPCVLRPDLCAEALADFLHLPGEGSERAGGLLYDPGP